MKSSPNELMDTDYITDTVVKRFVTAADTRLQTWLDNTESEIITIAKSFGVEEATFVDNVDTNGINYKVKGYIISYFCYLICQDVWCTNDVESSDQEIYKLKLEWYKNVCNDTLAQLTKEMFVYDLDSMSQVGMIGVGQLFRG